MKKMKKVSQDQLSFSIASFSNFFFITLTAYRA